MSDRVTGVRNAARAVIVRDGCVLLLRKAYEAGVVRYALPGGAQEWGETLQQALVRECEEEIGVAVEVRDLMHLADYFKPRETEPPSTRHLVEFLFDCAVPDDYRPRNGHRPDRRQEAVVWAPLGGLGELALQPASLKAVLTAAAPFRVYLGTID